jgi:hypothetical protein
MLPDFLDLLELQLSSDHLLFLDKWFLNIQNILWKYISYFNIRNI